MPLSPATWILLEKAATDNGFDVEGPRIDDWRTYSSSQCPLRIWLSTAVGDEFLVAFSMWSVHEGLSGCGRPVETPLPPGAAAARSDGCINNIHAMLRRAFQLARALPDAPLQLFYQRTAHLPRSTESERLVIQRVGQDIFRARLIDLWDGRCAITGLALVDLLLASHIKAWSQCENDEERLCVFNGLLLAPHYDKLFDRGYLTIGNDGRLILAAALDAAAQAALGLDETLRVRKLQPEHQHFLDWHREKVFKGGE